MMPLTSTVFSAEYRASGYDEEDAGLLRAELEEFGAVRLRALQLPEAGGSHELSLVINFVGLAAISGIAGHIASKQYDRLAAALGRFFDRKTAKDFEPEMTVSVSYDDIDLVIGPLTRDRLRELPKLADSIYRTLQGAAFSGRDVTRIVIGVFQSDNEWHVPHLQEWPENDRFWGVSLEGHRMLTHVYDTETGLLAEVSIRQ